MRKIVILLVVLSHYANAQNEDILRFMPNVPQSQWFASANKSSNKVTKSLPLVSNNTISIYNSGFALRDIYTLRGDTAVLSLGKLIDGLRDENLVSVGYSTALLAVQVNKKNMGIGFSINDKVNVGFTYPGALPKFIKNGNGATMGVAQNVGGFKVNANYQREFNVHLQKTVKNLTIGISPKVIFGQLNINTVKSELSLLTDTSYFKITGTSEFEVRTSGLDTAGLADNFSNFDYKTALFNTKNMGFGLNIGAAYELKKFRFAAGVNDIGYVLWKDKIKALKSDKVQVTYEGLSLNQIIAKDSLNYKASLDSIAALLKLDFLDAASYRTNLNAQYYVMANYSITKMHHVGASVVVNSINKLTLPSFSLCYQFMPSKRLNAAVSYNARRYSSANVGLGLMLKGIGTQWYLASDNVQNIFVPLAAKNFSVAFGANIAIGTLSDHKKADRVKKKSAEDSTSK
jgi:hypothetical protein